MDADERGLLAWLASPYDGLAPALLARMTPQWINEHVDERAWLSPYVRAAVDGVLAAALRCHASRDAALRTLKALPHRWHSLELAMLLLDEFNPRTAPKLVRSAIKTRGGAASRACRVLYEQPARLERLWKCSKRWLGCKSTRKLMLEVLPGFCARDAEHVRELCSDWHTHDSRNSIHAKLFCALSEHFPDLFTIQNTEEHIARDLALCRLYCVRLWVWLASHHKELHPDKPDIVYLHPRIAASVVYARGFLGNSESFQISISPRQCGASSDCVCWLRAFVDQLLRLQLIKDQDISALEQCMWYSGDFIGRVRLAAHGYGTSGRLDDASHMDKIAYAAGDVAAALATPMQDDSEWQRCAYTDNDGQPLRRDTAWHQFTAHLYWLSLSPYKPWPAEYHTGLLRTLPMWTPDTHLALYAYSVELHDVVQILFMLHELRPQSALARLPYELLFIVMEYARIGYCEAHP